MAWEGVNFFQNQECVNILGCFVTFYEYKSVLLMLVDNVCTILHQAIALVQYCTVSRVNYSHVTRLSTLRVVFA